MSPGAVALFALLAGIFVLVAVATDWNWFFEHPKAKFFVDHFGRDGARIFYTVLGCALIVLAFACSSFSWH